MAVRPWENRFLDINLRDGVMVHENESTEAKDGSRSGSKSVGKKPIVSTVQSNLLSQKAVPFHSNGCDSSPSSSAGVLEASHTQFGKPNAKPCLEDSIERGNLKPDIASRSHSNPKERTTGPDKQAHKRLSLPSNGESPSFCVCVCGWGVFLSNVQSQS